MKRMTWEKINKKVVVLSDKESLKEDVSQGGGEREAMPSLKMDTTDEADRSPGQNAYKAQKIAKPLLKQISCNLVDVAV